jgi:predicted RND superfamily exporter protein
VVVATVVSVWLTAYGLRLSSDLSTLFPESGDAAALTRWAHAFGGRDPAIVLVRGDRAEDVAAVADGIAASLRKAPSVLRVVDRVPRPAMPEDPTLAWAYAGPAERAALAAAVTPEGMRARLAETKALVLAPVGDADADAYLTRDPLRLAQIPWQGRAELAAGVVGAPGMPFETSGGRARLVIAEPRGSAFEAGAARALVSDVEHAEAAAARPGVSTELAGGHAIAKATEDMIRGDLEVSGTLSLLLASVAFVATFRRVRALAAVIPPLLVGTVWTTGLAAFFPSGVTAVAIGFAAVVVGVGVDTGVHVYAALLEARREGLPPAAAAAKARATTWKPTLTAAAVAAVAFASLAFGSLRAMKQLGLLCGAGELLTSVAILVMTPEIGAWLERGPPPPRPTSALLAALTRATSTRRRAGFALALCALPVGLASLGAWPRPANALVAVRPRGLAPLVAQEHLYALFGGRPGQWVVLTADPDPDRARTRADRVAEALEAEVHEHHADGFDALATFAPSETTRRARLSARDALDLPSRKEALAAALVEQGFDVGAFAPALEAFAHPSPIAAPVVGEEGWLFARHLARDAGDTLVATYVRPAEGAGSEEAIRAAVLRADPGSSVTGFGAIDLALRRALGRDLAVVGGLALVLVTIAMRLALRSGRHALVALATLACEMAAVGVAMRMAGVGFHVYDALVLPVLFGVTIDESMFLLHAAGRTTVDEAVRTQGPLVAATALTTAAGFAALAACRFDGLRDLGIVGAAGVLAGLVAALVVVPASLRLLGRE